VRRQGILILTASALGLIAICIAVIGAWDIFTEASSQKPAPQEQMSPAELSTAIEAQRQAYAKLTRSATFNIPAKGFSTHNESSSLGGEEFGSAFVFEVIIL
jgi:hypothetical protein